MINEKMIQNRILRMKITFLQMYYKANAGHIGSSLSCAEVLGVIWFHFKNHDDRVILSKGHAAAALYATLYEAGIVNADEIKTFYSNNTILPAHPPVNKFDEIPFATGSLGHGLSIAAGFAYSNKIKKIKAKVFCITSDGELNEGSIWEAALFISHHELNNLIWFIDRNRFQGFGGTEETIKLDPLDKKLEAFGFNVFQINGHSVSELMNLKMVFQKSAKPIVVIANTVKGNGWTGKSDTLASHYLPITELEYNIFLNNLNNAS
jgi:transketolase